MLTEKDFIQLKDRNITEEQVNQQPREHHPQLSRPERRRRFPHPDAQLRRGEAGGRRQRRVRVGEEPPRRVRDLPEVIFCR